MYVVCIIVSVFVIGVKFVVFRVVQTVNANRGKRPGRGTSTQRRRRRMAIQGKDSWCQDSTLWIILTLIVDLCGGGTFGGLVASILCLLMLKKQ